MGSRADVRDECHVLSRREAGDEIVELKHEAHAVPAEEREGASPPHRSAPSLCSADEPEVGTSSPPRMLSNVDLPLPDAPTTPPAQLA